MAEVEKVTPDPEETEEKPEPTPEEKWESERKKLNEEAKKHRLEAKAKAKELEAKEALLKDILTKLEVDEEHDLETRISESRAAAEKVSKAGPEVVQLQNQLSTLNKELKKEREEKAALAKERDDYSRKFESTVIDHALRKGLADYDLKPSQQTVMEDFLRKKMKLNERQTPVWVVTDEEGDIVSEVPVKDGLASFFDKNPDLLPPQTPSGGGTRESNKTKPSRSVDSMNRILGEPDPRTGIRKMDRSVFNKEKKNHGLV